MKLVSNRYQQQIDFDFYPVYFLVIENSQEYLKVVEEFYSECNGNDESQFVLSNNSEIISISKNCLFVHNYFDLDINNKKIINEINNRVEKVLPTNNFVEDFYKLNKLFVEINDKIVDCFDIELEYDTDLTFDKFIKMSSYKIATQSKFVDRLVSYIKMYCALKKTKLIIFVGLSSFLSKNELELFIKELKYLELNCLLIEPSLKYNLENVGRIIIDEDLCEI